MRKGVFALAAFLGALGIGLFWFNGFVEDLKETSQAVGKAECEAENARKEVVEAKKEKEVENEKNIKKAVIWARPNSRLSQLIRRMREQGIGTINNHSENSHLPVGR